LLTGRTDRARRAVAAGAFVALAALGTSALAATLGACDTGSPAAPALPTPPSAAAPMPTGDADPSPLPAGDRQLGLATDRSLASYPEDLRAARDAGARLTTVETTWDVVERAFDAGDGDASATALYEPTLHIAGLVAPALGTRAVLELDLVDDGGRRTPADLATTALDDPAFIARWVKAQAYVLDQTRELDVASYVIGARVDRGLGRTPAAWAAFTTFFMEAGKAARAARPGLEVGFVISPAALASLRSELEAAWAASDLVAVRLDPVGARADAGMPSPEEAAAAIASASATAPAGKRVIVLGATYPGSASAGGSAAAQAQYVGAAFAAWDRTVARAPVLVFGALTPAGVDAVRKEARVRGFL
jgi:hypothetical protein